MLNLMSPAAVRFRLADIIKARGMTQKEFAEAAKLSENAVSKLSGTPRQIRLDTIDRICEVLKIEPGELFERENKSAS